MSKVYKCKLCKESFREEELVQYASPNSVQQYRYCPKCLQVRQDEDYFISTVTRIFGLKKPGSRIWGDRKRLQENYGYNDRLIADCLIYVYEVEKIPKKSNSLYFVNPTTIDRMAKYKRAQVAEANSIAQAMNNNYTEYIVPIKEHKEKEKPAFDFDSFFND